MSFQDTKFDPSKAAKLPRGYAFSDSGLVWRDPGPLAEGEDPKPDLFIAGHFDVAAMTRDGNGNSWGLLLKFKDADGRDHSFVLPNEMLAGEGAEARKVLQGQGLRISPTKFGRGKFNEFLLSR